MATIQDIRFELGDTSTEFPMMTDAEIRYFLFKNDCNLQRTAMDVAKSLLLKLSMRTDETVDLFSIKGSQAAKNYMQALKMYISNPDLNRLYDKVTPYAGGISKTDMLNNDAVLDNNVIVPPTRSPDLPINGYFEV
jgi:hypothetical protein